MFDQTEFRVLSGHFNGLLRGGRKGGAPHLRKHRVAEIHATSHRQRPWSRHRVWSQGAWASVLAASLALAGLSLSGPAVADVGTIAHDSLRTGWDKNEPGLSPSAVASSNFGKLFSATVDGQVYAQPLVVGGTVIAATEKNAV